jgi:hypothetical protein
MYLGIAAVVLVSMSQAEFEKAAQVSGSGEVKAS